MIGWLEILRLENEGSVGIKEIEKIYSVLQQFPNVFPK